MKIRTTLKEFLETGQIGALKVGATEDDVRTLLGEPTYQSNPYPKKGRYKHKIVAWQYGCIEIGFEFQSIIYLGFDYQGDPLPDNVLIDGYFPSKLTTMTEFESYLLRESIAYQDYEPLTSSTQRAFVMGPNVTAVFDMANERLDSIYASK